MAYPEDQDTFRDMEDINGVEYDESDTKTIFAKDLNDLATAIQNIEAFVGYDNDIVNSPLYLLIAKLLYPVGKIVEFSTGYDPNTSLGFGTWAKHGEGRVTVAQDSGTFSTLDSEGGDEEHSHNLSDNGFAKIDPRGGSSNDFIGRQINTANYGVNYNASINDATTVSGTASQATALGGDTDDASSLQPYKVVVRWVRTA